MLDIIAEIFILSAAIFVGSAAYDWWRRRNLWETNMNLIKFIRSFFSKPNDDSMRQDEIRKHIVESDFIDYDGMGNQGRFPVDKKKRKWYNALVAQLDRASDF